jgi:hypothetical protein
MLVTDHGNWLVALGLIVVSGFGDADSGRGLVSAMAGNKKGLCADARASSVRPSGTSSRLKPNHEQAQTSPRTRAFASVQPHASFTLTAIRHDN